MSAGAEPMSAEPVTLSDADLARLAEMLAPRIAEELRRAAAPEERAQHPGGLVDASEAAARLGVGRAWVYRHAPELGAVKLGDGRRARLRFDPERLSELVTARVENRASSAPIHRRRQGSGRSLAGRTARGNPLLPVPAYDEEDK